MTAEQENELIEELKDKLLATVEGSDNDVIAVYALLGAVKHIANFSEENQEICDLAISEVFDCGILSNEEFKKYVEGKTGCQLV